MCSSLSPALPASPSSPQGPGSVPGMAGQRSWVQPVWCSPLLFLAKRPTTRTHLRWGYSVERHFQASSSTSKKCQGLLFPRRFSKQSFLISHSFPGPLLSISPAVLSRYSTPTTSLRLRTLRGRTHVPHSQTPGWAEHPQKPIPYPCRQLLENCTGKDSSGRGWCHQSKGERKLGVFGFHSAGESEAEPDWGTIFLRHTKFSGLVRWLHSLLLEALFMSTFVQAPHLLHSY